jgi:predicted GIY-YIG superfamily endonuclease
MINWNKKTIIKYIGSKTATTYEYILSDEEVENTNNHLLNNEVTLSSIYETYNEVVTDKIKIGKSKFNKDSNTGYVYIITNLVNNKKYIGRSINAISRITEHIRSTSSKELKQDLIKYGLINFMVKVKEVDNYKQVEKDMITQYGLENLYNKI